MVSWTSGAKSSGRRRAENQTSSQHSARASVHRSAMGLWISGTKKFLYLNIKRPGSLVDVAGLQVESAGKDAGDLSPRMVTQAP